MKTSHYLEKSSSVDIIMHVGTPGEMLYNSNDVPHQHIDYIGKTHIV